MYQNRETGTSSERQLYILSLLSQSRKGYTLREIIRHLERIGIDATRRMVARDMDTISRNFFVYEEEIDGRLVFKADKYGIEHMDFTMPQIISLYYLKQILASNRQLDLSREAEEIIDTILEQMPTLSKAAMDEIAQMVKVAPVQSAQEKTVDEQVLRAVRDAAMEKQRIRVTYTSFSSGETTERMFDPYILEVREGRWHSIGWCHKRNSVRDLRISRMQSVEPTKKTFEIPKDFYEEYKRTRFDKMAGSEVEDIVIRFTGKAARLVQEYHADMADTLTQTDEGLLFEKSAALTPDIKQWVLRFGSDAKVLAPDTLAHEIQEEAQQIIKNYSEKP